jgi:hypothetical protein
MRLLFLIRVIEGDDIAITGRPQKPAVEFAEEPSGELFIPRNVGEAFLLVGRKIHQRGHLKGPPCSRTSEGHQREDTSDRDTGGGNDSDRDSGGVEALVDEDEEPLAEECEHLVPLFSSITNK